jgi:hypothetical protein
VRDAILARVGFFVGQIVIQALIVDQRWSDAKKRRASVSVRRNT